MIDPALLAALRAGDGAAIDRMYRELAPSVLGWVIRLGGPDLDAEDVAHEVFATAIPLLPKLRGDARLSTWMFAVTRRVVANARRRAAVRRFFGLDEAREPSTDEGPERLVGRAQRRRAVQRALDRLSAEHREVIVLCALEERSAPEAAELLGVPVGTVHSRMFHARARFARALEREGVSAESTGAIALDGAGGGS